MPRPVPLALLLAAALALTGCAGAPAEGSPDAAAASAEGGHEAPAEEAPAEGGHGEEAAPAEMPEDFPHDVPIIEGELTKGALGGGIWTIGFASHDITADLAHAIELLLAAGFTQTVTEALYGDFTSPDYLVRVYVSEEDAELTYLVTPQESPVVAVEEEAPAEESGGH